MSTLFNLELFTLHLASQLLGAECIKQKLNDRVESRLYWKTPFLLDVDPETKRLVQNSSSTERKIFLLDATFELNPSKDTMVSMYWGVIVVEGDEGRHFSSKNLTLSDLEQHFGKLDIDVQSTPESALAKTMSQALKIVTKSKPLLATDPISISLFYQDLDQSADLTIESSNDGSEVHSSILDKLLLNLTNDTIESNVEESEVSANDEELASLLQQWKEQERANNASRATATEVATTASQATKPPESSPKEVGKENGTSPASQTDKPQKVVKIKGRSRPGPFRPGAAKKKKAKLTFAGE